MYESEKVEEARESRPKRHDIVEETSVSQHKPVTTEIAEQDLLPEEIGEVYGNLRLVDPLGERHMQASLERYGQMSPVVVCQEPSGGYELLDGFKRLRASRRLCEQHPLRARILSVGSRAAKAAVLCLNWVSRSVSNLEEGWVVRALCREDGLTQVEVGEILNRDHSWVSRRLSLVERLSEEVQSRLRLGLITGTIGRELARVPRGTQERILEAITTHNLGSREVAGIVKLIEDKSPKEQSRILRSPREALSVQGKEHSEVRDSRLAEAGNRLLQDLSRMERICSRVTSTMGIHGLSQLRPGELEILASSIGRAQRASRQASDVLQAALVAPQGQRDDTVQ